jgi:hypothetical protein
MRPTAVTKQDVGCANSAPTCNGFVTTRPRVLPRRVRNLTLNPTHDHV